MKLIFCPECNDVRKLQLRKRRCHCGRSWGKYLPDRLHATIGGQAIPIGFENASLVRAIKARPDDGIGIRFDAFVIPWVSPTIDEE